MINPWDWCEYYLLVTIRNRAATEAYLLDHVRQEDFFEHYVGRWVGGDVNRANVAITDMTITPLTEESFELLEPHYKDVFKLGG